MSAATGLVLILAIRTIRSENRPNGFKRTFYEIPVKLLEQWHKPSDVAEIAGISRGELIFRTRWPGVIWVMNNKEQRYDTIPFPGHERAAWSYQYIPVDSTLIIAAGNVPALYFKDGDHYRDYRFGTMPFTRIARISASSYIARGFDTSVKSRDQVFIKENIQSAERKTDTGVFPLIQDAGLSTDGNLHFDRKTGLLSYVPFYSNNLIALDTNLNIVYRAGTIDSVLYSHTNIGVITTGDQQKYTNTGPRKIVNTDNCVNNGLLYNHSLLKADNEDPETFRNNAVIDLYDIAKGEYRGSIYLPDYKHEQPTGFKVMDSCMFVLYKSQMIRYGLPPGTY